MSKQILDSPETLGVDRSASLLGVPHVPVEAESGLQYRVLRVSEDRGIAIG